MREMLEKAADVLVHSKMTIALTGAGISVESGIPDFRSAGGLWEKFDPAEYATIEAFRANPEKVWEMLREMEEVVLQAKPNKAHIGLGELEKLDCLHYIITQNVDNLHQAGGARNVIEYHGNSATLSCIQCGRQYNASEKRGEHVPKCACGNVLKPDVIFFGEAIPAEAMNRSFQLASVAQALLVIGTSAAVSPANTIPGVAKRNGAKIIEINKEETHLTSTLTDIFLQGSAGEIVSGLVGEVKDRKAKS
ncbi:MAG: NAD-dependent deacylase [Deltaproteobacteria bacterium]|nr:NAD-dependent deacylase [Deltaproteobacteria bacterium]